MKKVTILGSTGSIGTQTLNVIDRLKNSFILHAIVGGSNDKLLIEQVKKYKPKYFGICEICAHKRIQGIFDSGLIDFEKSLTDQKIFESDIIVVAISGFAAIDAVIKAIKLSKVVALATKEVLVAAGDIIMPMAKKYGAQIVPIDSEHSAIFQALDFDFNKPFKRLILTASGGPFVDKSKDQLKDVTINHALAHPNWQMGKKITVDSATMMNKGLEIIEAMHLFNCPLEKIDAVIHRQSIIHSMVEFEDSSLLAQMSVPSMEIPIQIALTYPKRFNSQVKSLNFENLKSLTFEKIDESLFGCYKIALDSARLGGNMPCAMNSANEIAVDMFLRKRIKFFQIPVLIKQVLERIEYIAKPDLNEIYMTDKKARTLSFDAAGNVNDL